MNISELCKLMHSLVMRKHYDKYCDDPDVVDDEERWIGSDENGDPPFHFCMLCNKKIMSFNESYFEKITEHAIEHFKEYNLLALI